MTIQLLLFGISTDLVGASTLSYEMDDNSTVGNLKDHLKDSYEGLNNIYDFALALNEEYAEDSWVLSEGDTVAIIPPVSGG